MNTLRLIGGFLIILGATGIGVTKTYQYYKQLSQLSELTRGMELIRCQLNYTMYSIPKLLFLTGNQLKSGVKSYFHHLGEKIEKGVPRHRAPQEALAETKGLSLPNDAIMALLDWSTDLGQFDLDGEDRMMVLSIKRMEQSYERFQADKKAMVKSYTLLGASAGFALMILLI